LKTEKECKMGDKRRKYTSKMKADTIRKVLKEKKSVAEVCEQDAIHVTQFYTWQREAFDRLERVFEEAPEEQKKTEQAELRELKERLNAKSIFCRELLEEHAKLKKSLGEI